MTSSPLIWRKSSHSTNVGDCVEVAMDAPGVLIRDSKNPQHTHLELDRASWAGLRQLAKSGSLDLRHVRRSLAPHKWPSDASTAVGGVSSSGSDRPGGA